MGSENRSGKVPLISKIAYGFGDVGCNFSWMFVSNFLMIFYTDVFGISMAAVSALMLFSRFWDAINDPIVAGKIYNVDFLCNLRQCFFPVSTLTFRV